MVSMKMWQMEPVSHAILVFIIVQHVTFKTTTAHRVIYLDNTIDCLKTNALMNVQQK